MHALHMKTEPLAFRSDCRNPATIVTRLISRCESSRSRATRNNGSGNKPLRMLLLVLPSRLLFLSKAFQWISLLRVSIPKTSSVVTITLEFMVKLASYYSLITSPITIGEKLSSLRLFLCNIFVIGLHPTVLLVTTFNIFASIKGNTFMVLLKYESCLNETASLFVLPALIAIIKVALWNTTIELLPTVFMPNFLVPILTFVFGRIVLIIPFVYSMQTPVQVWILLVLKLLLAVVITSRIWSTLAVMFGVVPLVIVMPNSSPTQERDCSWADTTKNMVYYDQAANCIKKTNHFCFDESFNGLALQQQPPNVINLWNSNNGVEFPIDHPEYCTSEDFNSFTTHFAKTHTHNINIMCDDSTFGLVIDSDETSHHAFISQISTKRTCSVVKHFNSHKSAWKHLKDFYIVAINDRPSFDTVDIIDRLCKLPTESAINFELTVAFDHRLLADERWRNL